MNYCTDYITHYKLDAEHFDYFDNPDPAGRAYDNLFRKFILKLAGKPKSVLDIGSGGGWTSTIPHEQILFVDLSLNNLAKLKSDFSAPVMADAHFLPFKNESQEFVIVSEILEHLNSPQAAAKEILRVLKPGGKAIVSTPYKENIRYTLCIHCNQPTPMNAHLHSFDRETLLSFFPSAKTSVYLFGSKVLTVIRAASLFEKLPLWVWRMVNYPLLKLVDKAQHIIIVLEK
ncbi:MAG: class I SAM-dependent methyltransferase [Bacteroidetes bacterium]|nr:class I SAM-dependent methyltransferase [Bacteroidota bacterium]MCL5738073.1 class I SAM-dependent methyltransferase [Bacteroidota bacterium]